MKRFISIFAAFLLSLSMVTTVLAAAANASQITDAGGTTENQADNTTLSKTIEGTDIENVFDITLKVTTKTNVQEITQDPDLAVVIVMDISETMNSEFGNTTRYKAAMSAATQFVNKYRSEVGAKSYTSKIGFVAFNTNSHKIRGMTTVETAAQATQFMTDVKSGCNAIISASGYASAHTRFTNIESGLKRGYNLIKNLPNQNKFVVFLSDGFPTTYIKAGTTYDGYDPYDPGATSYVEGHFYDGYDKHPCSLGTSYSDRAAIKARQQATTMKNDGVEIFSIGIDVGGQTITKYDTHQNDSFSVIDRSKSAGTNKKYEIGAPNSAQDFKDWLKGSATNNSVGIGSGYYYDSTNQTGLVNALTSIFNEMKTKTEERSAKAWQVSDPMGTNMEFIGFYDKNNALKGMTQNLTGSFGSAKENTATYTASTKTFNWNLQKSGYSLSTDGTYTFTLKYRVRLTNEAASGFAEGTSYNTNGTTTLTYNVITTSSGTSSISPQKTMNAKIPKVKGYLGELSFTKVDQYGRPVSGAKFTLEHDEANCKKCRGTSTASSVPITGNLGKKTSTSAGATANTPGKVTFSKVPSGHKYILKESEAPAGYTLDSTIYSVEVAYDVVTTTIQNNKVTDPMDEYQIKLKKVDGTSQQVLSGATFKVYSNSQMTVLAKHPDGSDIGDITTSDDGIANLGILDFNKTYYLKETKAPDGYEKLIDSVNITISPTADNKVTATNGSTSLPVTKEDGTALIYIVTVKNTPGAALPETGGPGTAGFVEAGIGFMALAMILLWIKRQELLKKTH